MTFRRLSIAIVLAAGLVLTTRGIAFAHATLLKATPAAGSRLAVSPSRIWLKFSEEMEPGMATITLTSADGTVLTLKAAGDPHDVSAIAAGIEAPLSGEYEVTWHVVSADGHPVGGRFKFMVIATGTAAPVAAAPAVAPSVAPSTTTTPRAPEESTWGPTLLGAPVVAAVLRGFAMATLAAFAGLLLFFSRETSDAEIRHLHAIRVMTLLGWSAVFFLALHAFAWMMNAIPGHQFTAGMFAAVLHTSTGGMELWRLGLAVLAALAFGYGRASVATVFAFLALAASGRSGHAAALYTAYSTPAKALHLMAGAVWLGGLSWLVVRDRTDAASFRAAAARVSSAALIAVLVVALSGVIQTKFFIGEWGALFTSSYGAVALAKTAGLLVLVGFGAYHRYRVMPSLQGGADAAGQFSRSLRGEITLMVAVMLLGGLLAYMPPPPAVSLPAASLTAP